METRPCKKCGKKMLKKYANYVLSSNPPGYPWCWWCGCGNTEDGGVEVGKTEEEVIREEWKKINK